MSLDLNTAKAKTTCPSVQPEAAGAQVFAVVAGTAEEPVVHYLDQALPMSQEIWDLASPMHPSEVFRLAGD